MKYLLALATLVLFQVSSAFAGFPLASEYFRQAHVSELAGAAARGDSEAMAKLLREGTDVNATGQCGMTPLIWAFLNQNKMGFDYLLEHGANPNAQLTDSMDGRLSEMVRKGNSAISLAAMHDDIWYLQDTLGHGGNPSLVNASGSDTPLFSAVFSQRDENAKLLVRSGSNVNWQNSDGVTAFMQAVMLNQYELAYIMLDAGADATLMNRWGNTVFYFINKSAGHTLPDGTLWRGKLVQKLKSKGTWTLLERMAAATSTG